MSSTLLILSMTFDHFCSIKKLYKASSRNTIKRAKIAIVCIIIISILFNIPYLLTITSANRQCVPDLTSVGKSLYYWLNYVVQFIIPFVALLTMNSIIIHTLRTRNILKESMDQGQGQYKKSKTSKKQIYIILLLVAFSFFVLITPFYAFILYRQFVNYTSSPRAYAGFFLFHNVIDKMFYTNNGINFFLYVISGQKFRTDLVNLFRCRNNHGYNTCNISMSHSSTIKSTNNV